MVEGISENPYARLRKQRAKHVEYHVEETTTNVINAEKH